MNTTIKIVFFGSPAFAGQILEHLVDKKETYQVVGVVTNPDKLSGRHRQLTESPVAQVANKYHLPVFKPEHLDDNNLAHVKLLKADIFLVAAYGKIIPEIWLAAPLKKVVNLHYSLLPKYRGALCVSEAIKNGDTITGATLMEMEKGLDSGPIIAQVELKINIDDNVASLTDKLTLAGLELLDKVLPEYVAGKMSPKSQSENDATYTPSFKSRTHQTAFLPWQILSEAMLGIGQPVHNLIRSLNPEPGAWTKVSTKDGEIELKLLESGLNGDQLMLKLVQIPGRNPVSWQQFEAGHPLKA